MEGTCKKGCAMPYSKISVSKSANSVFINLSFEAYTPFWTFQVSHCERKSRDSHSNSAQAES